MKIMPKLSLPFSDDTRMIVRLAIGLATGLVGLADMLSAYNCASDPIFLSAHIAERISTSTRGAYSIGSHNPTLIIVSLLPGA